MSGMPGGLGGLGNPYSGGFNNPYSGGFNNPYSGMAGPGIPGAAGGCAPGDPNCQNDRLRLMQNSGGWAPPGMGYGAGRWYGAAPQATPATLGQPLPGPSQTSVGPAPYVPTILNQATSATVGPYY